jgi:hypothetical protein
MNCGKGIVGFPEFMFTLIAEKEITGRLSTVTTVSNNFLMFINFLVI